ncbi:hypothetical protein C0J52_22044 [Blattella germanica]|nr:hypothetical protein C0J52_22044 [Blattella germanica]
MMDDIKQEIEEFKLETICDQHIDVNECDDQDLFDQTVKLEKKQELIYELKQDMSENKDKEFEFISLAHVKEEVDADSDSKVRRYCLYI